ncbi:hypothetical protein M408DRAFT_329873 [Serendipita vermifera MAFF 305830]|uniref:Uncharacterized protein n=1 Tax=Serendipita vermifera MAFF 305830 TaxID=933852 RepID=A0A0C3B8B7_SERVB|nr:hypothetical protein M408DRAFT_329873 [Serendipita vermifera MAFF 305830]
MCFYLYVELVLCPHLVLLERLKCLAFRLQEIHCRESTRVVDKGYPVLESLSCYDG